MTMEALWDELGALRWRVSAAWARRAHDCTLAGITSRCGGGCCSSPTFWPPNSSEAGRAGQGCAHLGAQGCTWAPDDRPVTCLLYPLKLNRAGMLVLHHRTTTGAGICKGNHGNGPPLIVALEAQLVELFGAVQYARVRDHVLAGLDSYFDVPDHVARAYEMELAQEELQEPPVARSAIRRPLPVLEVMR